MPTCQNYFYYNRFIRRYIISKHNTVNYFFNFVFTEVQVIFALKEAKKSVNLLLFWLVFVLIGKKPIIVKTSGLYKKKKIKFIITLTIQDFISSFKMFAFFVFPRQEKKHELRLKKESNGFFFFFKDTFLDSIETFPFYNFISWQDWLFLLDKLFLIIKFKAIRRTVLKTGLNSLQIPAVYDTKRN